MSVYIRKVERLDLLDLVTLADDEWKPKISTLALSLIRCDGDIERGYVAEESGVIIGFIYGFVLPNGLLLPEMLYVRKDHRKTGVGTMLLQYLEKESKCKSSMIFYNKSLHDYYAKRGYIVGENLETALKTLKTLPHQRRPGHEVSL